MKKFYVGAYGIELIIVSDDDLSGANGVELHVKKPNGTEVVWQASIEDGNEIHYVLQDGDLDMPGTYKVQPVVIYTDKKLFGSTINIVVYDKYN